MGNEASWLPDRDLTEYAALTFLTKREILKAWRCWTNLVGKITSDERLQRYHSSVILKLPQLKENPFGKRIVQVFSSEKDDQMNFEDFLDMLSAMCEKAPFQLKAHYAFKIYDMNEDGVLDESDLTVILDRLTLSKLGTKNKTKLAKKILNESDLDGDGISKEEFEHLLTKCQDFSHVFRFSI